MRFLCLVTNQIIVHRNSLTDAETSLWQPQRLGYHRTWLNPVRPRIFVCGGAPLTLLLTEEDVRALLPMGRAIELVEHVLRLQGEGDAENGSRQRVGFPHGTLNYMGGAVPPAHATGIKVYPVTRSSVNFVVLLFGSESGTLLAIIEADWMGRIRTGAASGVAARYLSSPSASVLGVIGAGGQAETQIEAVAEMRQLELVKVFSRNPERRQVLADRVRDRLGIAVKAVETAEAAVRESNIVTAITSASQPVFDGSWLAEGAHVNAAGNNRPHHREVDAATVRRAGLIATDSLPQARIECGDLIMAVTDGALQWDRVVELGDIIAGRARGRQHTDEITLFESQGIAIEDVAVAREVYDRAVEAGRGRTVPFGGSE